MIYLQNSPPIANAHIRYMYRRHLSLALITPALNVHSVLTIAGLGVAEGLAIGTIVHLDGGMINAERPTDLVGFSQCYLRISRLHT
ncbi:hypothetical protein EON65_41130 [archaeon]|nr:MAG: hypothetical protein EON65_41130 [archaeon]